MKKFRIFGFSITVLIFSIISLSAQNNTDAEKVINNLIVSTKTSAIKTNFQLSTTEKKAVTSPSISGSFILKGNKFVLEMSEVKSWFDGKTQWTYSIADNEVSISEPTDQELVSINPMAILSGYKAKSTVRFSKTKSSQNYIIELIPINKKENFSFIEVQINKTNGDLVKIKLSDKKGTNTVLNLSNYQKISKITDESFQFNRSKFKGVTVNDLR